jgi:hypothetical protein
VISLRPDNRDELLFIAVVWWATLTRNARERAFLLARADACDCKH